MQRRFDWVFALGALAGIGCSGPVPTAAAVGLQINVSATGACGVVGAQPPDDVGNPPPDHSKGISGKRVYDGEGGVSASCSVKGAGPWQISTRIASNNPRVTFLIDNGVINTDGSGTGSISLSTQAIANSVSSPPGSPCTLTAIESGDGITVKPGAVWATFSCPNLYAPPSQTCFVNGEFVLENCDK
ncbi:MAG: hypothetical protein ACOY0T_02170 [Myxococcota bacterium]